MKRRGLFGYLTGLGKLRSRASHEWVDASVFLIQAQDTLPDEGEEKPKYTWGKIALLVIGAILTFRLTNLQIAEGNENRYLAEGNRIRRQVTVAPRGAIVDRKGNSLVTNEAGYSLDIIPADLPRKKTDREEVIKRIVSETKVDEATLTKQIEKEGIYSLNTVTVIPSVSREQALVYKVKLANVAGVRVSYVPTRKYDTTAGLAHLLGYTSRMTDQDLERHPDYHRSSPIGRSGIESSYDIPLRGDVGTIEMEVNANGQLQRILKETPPKVGETLRLTLDKGLQQEMALALEEAMAKNKVKQAVGIAIDPRTGGILASVSLPTYDNNLFAKGISQKEYEQLNNDPERPLLNRTTDGQYPPGSTIKPLVAAMALQEKTIASNTTLDTSVGVIKIGQWEFPDWKVHGITDFRQAIAESNDIFFYALGGGWDKIPGLGVERMRRYYTQFGFGRETGIDYATERKGLVPDPEWKKRVKKESWYIGDTYHIAIGQGNLLVTPIQLARAISSLVNGGKLTTPHIVGSIEDSATQSAEQPYFSVEDLNISQEVLGWVKEGMQRTVTSDTGSARTLKSLPFTSGGKTGTAQFGADERLHAWYVGFAPYENPEIVTVVLVEGGGEGNAIAVPVASRVFQHYMANK